MFARGIDWQTVQAPSKHNIALNCDNSPGLNRVVLRQNIHVLQPWETPKDFLLMMFSNTTYILSQCDTVQSGKYNKS
jgi:hypothetical protein